LLECVDDEADVCHFRTRYAGCDDEPEFYEIEVIIKDGEAYLSSVNEVKVLKYELNIEGAK